MVPRGTKVAKIHKDWDGMQALLPATATRTFGLTVVRHPVDYAAKVFRERTGYDVLCVCVCVCVFVCVCL